MRDAGVARVASRARIWTALVAVWIVWGTTYLAIRVVDQSMPPLLAGGLRFVIAGGILFAWSIRRGDREGDRPTAAHWRAAALIGAGLVLGGNGFVMLAEKQVPSGFTALMIATVPLWMALADRVLFGRRMSPRSLAGLGLGFGGAALLVADSIAGHVSTAGAVMLVLAALSWTAGSLYARGADLPARSLLGTGMEMLAGGAMQIVAGLLLGEWSKMHPSTFHTSSLLALAYLALFGSLIGFASYTWLIRVAPISLASTYAYVNPVVAVILGSVILGERFDARTLLAGALVIASVALIVSAQPRTGSGPHEAEAPGAAAE
jgi:drug/metabolite transporter (DMT)-like permease